MMIDKYTLIAGVALFVFLVTLLFTPKRYRVHLIGLGAITAIGWYGWITYNPLLGLSRYFRPDRNLNVVDLLIQPEDISSGWIYGTSSTGEAYYHHSGDAYGEVVFYPEAFTVDPNARVRQISGIPFLEALSTQSVDRAYSRLDADRIYTAREARITHKSIGILRTTLSHRPDGGFTSRSANRSRTGCVLETNASSPLKHQFRCFYVAQYEEYVTTLQVTMVRQDEFHLSDEDFLKIVDRVDEIMHEQLTLNASN